MEDTRFIRSFSADVQYILPWGTGLDSLWSIDYQLAHHWGKQCYFSAGMRGALPKVKTPLNFTRSHARCGNARNSVQIQRLDTICLCVHVLKCRKLLAWR